jgi:protein SFI1
VENDVCVQHEDWAEDAIYYFTVRRTLRRWVRAFKDSKRRRLRAAFHTLSRKTKRDLAGVVMSIWRHKSNLIGRMEETARDSDRGRRRAISLSMLQHWHRRMDDLSTLRAAAESIDSTRLLRHHLLIWIDNHNRIQELEERAEILSESSAVRAAVKCFNAWETRSWHLHMLRMTADRKFERKRLKTLLRMWRDQALERIEARERAERTRVHAPAGNDDTIDEEFGEDWVPPIHPGRSTTPVGNLGLNSMLTTPRRNATTTVVRNRLFVRTPAGTPASPLLRFSGRRTADLGRSRLGR